MNKETFQEFLERKGLSNESSIKEVINLYNEWDSIRKNNNLNK